MKTKYLGLLLIGTGALAAVAFVGGTRESGLVVHEWGTFTSLQGSDGVPLKWNPFESSRLPRFVYDWNRSGLRRMPSGLLTLGTKQVVVTLQRMETPVIYFYSDKEQTVDMSVRFPQGGITEWYPQAPEIGPSSVPPSKALATLDEGLHHCGVSPNFTLASIFSPGTIKESVVHWPDLRIVPVASHPAAAELLPSDRSGSHYFAARETDSAYVEAPTFSPTNSAVECEKFLFYRGVGNFTAPLGVSMNSEGAVTVANTGKQPLSHMFVLRINGQRGDLVSLSGLRPGESKEASLDLSRLNQPLDSLRKEIRQRMADSLTAEGLYPREANAMVNTWDDSWFAEEGVRVLYILPRAWTDEILPMRMNPKPRELVRVMVGRAELIAPDTESKLTRALVLASEGESAAGQEVKAMVAKLGRFAQPVFGQALDRAGIPPVDRGQLAALLYEGRSTSQR
jgi:hypothetical protein